MVNYIIYPWILLFNFAWTVNCSWGAWSVWETCPVTCGGGTQERNRAKTQEALFGGNECTGNDLETQPCNNNGCPGSSIFLYDIVMLYNYIICPWTLLFNFTWTVNCLWGAWSAWETCSVTCGGGTQERNRAKTQDALFGGYECTGNDKETQSCNNNGCPGLYIFLL